MSLPRMPCPRPIRSNLILLARRAAPAGFCAKPAPEKIAVNMIMMIRERKFRRAFPE